MSKIIMDPLSIRIPINTLVLICGVSSSGKTTFTKKIFQKEVIVCCDDILLDIAKAYPKSSYFEINSRVQDYITNKIISLGWCYRKTVVIDAIGVTNNQRLALIAKYQNCFSTVIQIVIQPNIKTILNRIVKKQIPHELQQFNLHYPNSTELSSFWQIIQRNINDCSIAKGTDTTYILHNTDNISIIIF